LILIIRKSGSFIIKKSINQILNTQPLFLSVEDMSESSGPARYAASSCATPFTRTPSWEIWKRRDQIGNNGVGRVQVQTLDLAFRATLRSRFYRPHYY
jgi:hypothetical protein